MKRLSLTVTFKSVAGTFVLFTLVLLFKPLMTGQSEEKTAAGAQSAPHLLVVVSAEEPGDRTLKLVLDRAIDQSDFADARWGLSVYSVTNARQLYTRNGERFFTPASNMKIFTTAVALDLLGADYRWRTSVYAEQEADSTGTIAGDLILYGRGAPDLVSQGSGTNNASLSQLADDLYQRGVRRVRGSVIGDESHFKGETISVGWQWNDLQWYFGAEASALSINDNQVEVSILPPARPDIAPEVRLSGSRDYHHLTNDMVTVKAGERMTLGIHRGLSDNNIRVWGQFPLRSKGYRARLSVHNPALWAAKLFVAALESRGIAVAGEARFRDSRLSQNTEFGPSKARELAFVTSSPLAEVVRLTNKDSVNLYAELLLRTLGRELGELVKTPEPPGRERGADESGAEVVRLWLNRAGIPTGGMAVHDGSGLSRLNLITPEQTVKILLAMTKVSSARLFRDSLPAGNRDGTLRSRFRDLNGRVFAKTGSLTYDDSLSGYIETRQGETLAFSIMCNDQTSRLSSVRLIDEIVSLLVNHPHSKP